MKYAFIQEHRDRWPIIHLCHHLGVSRNGYYHWLRYGDRRHDPMLEFCIRKIFEDSFQTYGQRRIKATLLRQYGWVVSKRRIGKIMHCLGLKVRMKRRFRVMTTDSKHTYAIAPNRLAQQFQPHAPNQAYVSDITYVRTREGWNYGLRSCPSARFSICMPGPWWAGVWKIICKHH